MKILGNKILFEDNDSIEDIKEYFSKIEKTHNKLFNKLEDESINNALIALEKVKPLHITEKEIKSMKKILEEEKVAINNLYKQNIRMKLSAFIALIDYICKKDIKHSFEYIEKSSYVNQADMLVGKFKGELAKQLESIQNTLDINPIEFDLYVKDYSSKKTKLPVIDFEKGFDKNIEIIENNFLRDTKISDFKDLVSEYKKFKKDFEITIQSSGPKI